MDDVLGRVGSSLRRMGVIGTLALAAAAIGCAAGDSSSDGYAPPDTPADGGGDGHAGTGGTGGTGGTTGDSGLDAKADQATDAADGDIDAHEDADASLEDVSTDVSDDVSDEGDALDDVDPDADPDACWNQVEVCDGLDNNCNGQKDENDPGGNEPCQVPNKQGICAEGTTHCLQGHLQCQQNTPASTEICDGLDNNCDGVVDNNTSDTGGACNTQLQGICAAGTKTCNNAVIECEQNLQPGTETCNGLDDDCNGTPDDGFPGSGQPCTVPNQLPNTPCSQGQTNCLGGQNGCTQTVFPNSEVCDGKDNDCNGTIDDPAVVDNKVCDTGLPGECSKGKTQCSGGVLQCIPNLQPGTVPETCNAKDDDCNGTVDDVANIKLECATKYSSAQNVMDWACTVGSCQVIACAGAYSDCDSAPANGCEVNTLNDLIHCGQCGHLCNSTHGTPSCNFGSCQIACNIGWGNCDGNVANGCEQSTTNSVDNCGSCGQQCEATTGTPTCTNSACSIACNAGLGNCDGDVSNGCESTLTNDPLHCGTCTKLCSAVGGVASCTNGTCGIACDPSSADCDNNVANGCEISLLTNTSNCGGCGNACSSNHGAASCTGGLCGITCAAGYGDCNNDVTDGCETNLGTSTGSCGACGNACNASNGTPSCNAGSCQIVCSTGWGNCDANVTNGCETDLNTDALHCGTCTGKCDTTHGTASCTGGACGITCSTGFADCNNNAADGCEVDLNADPAHCGTCAKVCDTTNGTPTCTLGACGIVCNSGYGDCDNSAANGCEVNLKTSPQNCNGCGAACDSTNGTATCSNGACGITCSSGYANCDSNVTNGCEVNTNTDVTHCGTCPNACSTSHATPACTNGVCAAPTCAANWGDCDGLASNGCEVDFLNDSQHCGSCSTICSSSGGTPNCNAGTCGIACTAPMGNCDGNSGNGCETNLSTSVLNCGGCGLACSTNNGAPTCSGSVCSIACSAGFFNCNANVADGCEINLTNDPEHCGTCTKVCNGTNGTPGCAASACTISCDAGYANCDNNANNGCEVNTKTDVNNCGTCAHVCNLANANEGCGNGSCTIASCIAPYANCDNDAATGCEVNTNTNVNNCGSCGNACSLPNATAACSAGGCVIASCNAGFANCDGIAANGCEVNLLADPTHCGSCSTVCNSTNGTATCGGGTCGITCNPGYGNCDGVASNGCEVNLKNDVNNCNGCNTVCNLANANNSCSNGACVIASCVAGFANCDGATGNGCEINTNTNVNNCGACNNACNGTNGTPSCNGASCQITCFGGWGNCDGSPANGCETNTTNNVNNCGGCGAVCDTTQPQVTSRVCAASQCQVSSCASGYYDQDGQFVGGCECLEDSPSNVCTNATNLGNVGVDGTITKAGNLTPTPTDTDWYVVTFSTGNSCNFSPKVSITGTNTLIHVYSSCVGSTPGGGENCRSTEGGNSTKAGLTTWEGTWSATCGYYQPIDPLPDNTQPWLTAAPVGLATQLWIEVYTTADATSCAPYTLTVTN